jgi:type II secretion system protein H
MDARVETMTLLTINKRNVKIVRRTQGHGQWSRAFTLVELILVMALLVIAMGIVYPSLRTFFRGRHLDSEARRFLSLTRYAQSQAISSGVPMQLWIDVATHEYGLQPYPGFIDANNTPVFYDLEPGLEMELPIVNVNQTGMGANNGSMLGNSSSSYGSSMGNNQSGFQSSRSQPAIGFRPDGTLIESSPFQITLRDEDQRELWIVQNSTRLAYEIVRPQIR